MGYVERINCSESGESYPVEGAVTGACPAGDYPEVHYDLTRIREEFDRDSLAHGVASLWRYAPLLPVDDPENAVTLGEGWTPLLPVPNLGATFGCANLMAKDEGRNPSGTFKDRGASVAITRHREMGVEVVIHNSSGNAGGAMALYAARAGIRCINLLPGDVLPASLLQSTLAGADTRILDGPWQESGRLVADAVEDHGWFNIGTLKEPYRLEGKKTMGYEIAEQLGWSLPDAIVYPTGGGLGAIAIYKAFRELQELGWVDAGPLPKLIVTQYEGCAPIVRAFQKNADHAELWTDLQVLPGGLKSTKPPGDKAVLKLIRETGGTAIAVSTPDALEAAALMTRTEGIFPCPESATTIAGLKTALDEDVVSRDARIVLVVTGSGLKSIPAFPGVDISSIGPRARI
ncbi:MAG: threonine synthase [Proteobacteria bacterium]|nr:threonine synthase [Pseudomonadota bacterium]